MLNLFSQPTWKHINYILAAAVVVIVAGSLVGALLELPRINRERQAQLIPRPPAADRISISVTSVEKYSCSLGFTCHRVTGTVQNTDSAKHDVGFVIHFFSASRFLASTRPVFVSELSAGESRDFVAEGGPQSDYSTAKPKIFSLDGVAFDSPLYCQTILTLRWCRN